jgi:hypothetical protein
MNPWLEAFWGPVHHEYVSLIGRQLAAQLPDDLYPQVETDVYVVDGDVRGRLFRPDVSAFDTNRTATDSSGGSTAIAVAEPILVRVLRKTVTLPHVAIREPRRNNRLVTAIELFSPTNKGDTRGRDTYRQKRDAYLAAAVNVVEIDLLRGGQDLTDIATGDLPGGALAPCKACVRLASPDLSDEAEYYPLPLRERLRRIAIPLRPGDADVVLDLQEPVDDIYVTGRYDLQINYSEPPDPPLSPDDAAWAAERIAMARQSV